MIFYPENIKQEDSDTSSQDDDAFNDDDEDDEEYSHKIKVGKQKHKYTHSPPKSSKLEVT